MGKCGCCQLWGLLLCKCLCEEMSMCKAESVQQRGSQSRSEWPITIVSDKEAPPACLYRYAGTWCAWHGDGWSPPLHHIAALAKAATPWRGTCECKWVIICWLIVLSFRNFFKVTWLRSSTWVRLKTFLGPGLRGSDSLHGMIGFSRNGLVSWRMAIPTSFYRFLTALLIIFFFFFLTM